MIKTLFCFTSAGYDQSAGANEYWKNKKQLSPEVIKEHGRANLANLKSMLS